jgi:hypothetical protein
MECEDDWRWLRLIVALRNVYNIVSGVTFEVEGQGFCPIGLLKPSVSRIGKVSRPTRTLDTPPLTLLFEIGIALTKLIFLTMIFNLLLTSESTTLQIISVDA